MNLPLPYPPNTVIFVHQKDSDYINSYTTMPVSLLGPYD